MENTPPEALFDETLMFSEALFAADGELLLAVPATEGLALQAARARMLCTRSLAGLGRSDARLNALASAVRREVPAAEGDARADWGTWQFATIGLSRGTAVSGSQSSIGGERAFDEALVRALGEFGNRTERSCSHGSWPAQRASSTDGDTLRRTATNIVSVLFGMEFPSRFAASASYTAESSATITAAPRMPAPDPLAWDASLRRLNQRLAAQDEALTGALDDCVAWYGATICPGNATQLRAALAGVRIDRLLALGHKHAAREHEGAIAWGLELLAARPAHEWASAWLGELLCAADEASRHTHTRRLDERDTITVPLWRVDPEAWEQAARSGAAQAWTASLFDDAPTLLATVQRVRKRAQLETRAEQAPESTALRAGLASAHERWRTLRTSLDSHTNNTPAWWHEVRALHTACLELDSAGLAHARALGMDDEPEPPRPVRAAPPAAVELRAGALRVLPHGLLDRSLLARWWAGAQEPVVVCVAPERVAIFDAVSDAPGLVIGARYAGARFWRIESSATPARNAPK